MFTLFIFLLLVYFNVRTETQDIEVINSGLMKLKKSDMIVVFYLTIRHHGDTPRRAMVTMVECCERITEEDTDCDLIDLYGGDFGVVQPGTDKNFTLLYPNVYGYNRRGSCLVNILHRCLSSPDSSEVHHRIDFDTTVTTEAVPSVLQGWYNPETVILCETPDLDPFDHCNPVNCLLKYSGYRNYYNRKWKMCQRVPACIADPEKELPDVIYVPNSNICRNLENAITKEDINLISSGKLGMKTSEPKMVDIRCHHGEIDPKTGLCICDYGWKSELFDQESYNPGSSIYSMCTIKCTREGRYKFVPAALGFMLALWVLFSVIFCERQNLFCSRRRQESGAEVYYPLRGSNDRCSTLSSSTSSTKPSFNNFKPNYSSHLSMPMYQVSEKHFKNPKSIRGSSKSRGSLSSDKNT